ncbi:MAG: flagellar basal body L-ring protein FlgH [Helicobacteraceae bacterium]|jgi:flagellar L-ring protein precursor FlgH|nr:flagellar basal body L-ring protein FlgH [Helicobacteraceae bacterium]
MALKTIFILAPLAFLGCAGALDPQMDFKPPEYVQQTPSREEEDMSNLGSLFGRGDNPIFSDRKAMRINDVVTVLINERSQSSTSANRQLNRSQTSEFAPGAITYAGTSDNGKKVANRVNGVIGFGFKSDSNGEFSGGGTATRTENFTTTVSARIVKIMQNGNYFIEGRREIMLENEKQVIQISGVVRPDDIMQNNTINSSYIADAKISYRTEGDIQRNAKQGWGTRLLNAILPF